MKIIATIKNNNINIIYDYNNNDDQSNDNYKNKSVINVTIAFT